MNDNNRPDGVSDMLVMTALDLCGGDPNKAAGALLGTAKALMLKLTDGNEDLAILALAKVLKEELDELRRQRREQHN